MLRLVINGEDRQTESSQNVQDLLQELDITGSHIAVAVNLEVIPRAAYADTRLKEGDKIEIVHAVGGGTGLPGCASNPITHNATLC